MMSDLDKLIEAVERGDASHSEFASMFPYPICDHAREAQSGSPDAAKALHEALLPGWGWGAGPWGARVWLCSDSPKWDGSERKEVDLIEAPARAWLIAILKAYRAQQEVKA